MIFELLLFILLFIFFYYIVLYVKLHYHFAKHGVKYKFGIPIFGNNFASTFGFKHITEDIENVYKAFPKEKYVMFMDGMKPIILVRDPELVKMITIKNFDHFMDKKVFFPVEIEPLFGCSLISLNGEKWRKMRAQLRFAFTPAKIRAMMPYMVDNANNVMDYLKNHINEDIDVADLVSRFNTDVIASAGFGIQVNSLKERDNKFLRTGIEIMKFPFSRWLYYFLTIEFPFVASMMQVLGIPLFPMEGVQFFRNIVAETMEYRKKHNIERCDFIDLLMNNTEDWTLDEITGQIFFAFLASYESSTSILTLCIHELALHPHYQEKLYQEVMATEEKYGELTFENIAELKFMDCVFNETQRKWSIAIFIDRICTKTYVLPPPNEGGLPYVLRPGDLVYNVVNAVHMDENYYPDPHVFKPERFMEQEIKPCTFMPFGMGPRSCLGIRYAMLKMKTLLYYITLNYKIVKCSKTVEQIRMKPHQFSVKAVGDTYVQFEPRH